MGNFRSIIYILIAISSCYGDIRELVPIEAPQNLTLTQILGKHVEIKWDPVREESVRGNFRGYLVRTWNHAGSQVYAFPPETIKVTVEFFPFSKNFITVSARNEKYVGPPSNAISFDAPQIEPNFPYIFQAFPLSNKSVFLKWSKPTQPNGILTGYKIHCAEIVDDGRLINGILHQLNDPDKLQAKLTGLKEGIEYEVSISAVNCAGESSEKNTIKVVLDEHQSAEPFRPDFLYKINYHPITKEECRQQPEPPHLSTIAPETKEYDYYDYLMGNDTQIKQKKIEKTTVAPSGGEYRCLVNCIILWLPDVHNNPGDHFYVKHRTKGEKEFQITAPELSEDFIILKEFDACKNHEIILTSVDGEFSIDSKLKVTPTVMFA